MNGIGKTGVTVLLIVGFIFVGIFLQVAGASKAFLGLLALGIFYGLKNMWRKPKDEVKSNEIKLNKDDSENGLNKL